MPSDIQINAMLLAAGAPPTPTNRDQMRTLLDAFLKFRERNDLRENLWAEFPASDAVHHARSKIARVEAMVAKLERDAFPNGRRGELEAEILDDSLDLINYAAFVARNVTGRK